MIVTVVKEAVDFEYLYLPFLINYRLFDLNLFNLDAN